MVVQQARFLRSQTRIVHLLRSFDISQTRNVHLLRSFDIGEDKTVSLRKTWMSPHYDVFQTYKVPVSIKSASMQYMYGENGIKYLDLLANNLTISVGHCHPVVQEYVKRQLEDTVHCSTMYANPVVAQLAERFCAKFKPRSDGERWKCHFAVSGTEAVDIAILLARVCSGVTPLMSMENAYHGSHGVSMAASGVPTCKHPMPETGAMYHMPVPQFYGNNGKPYDFHLLNAERFIKATTDGRVAGCLMESLQGYGGIHPLDYNFMNAVADATRAAGGFVIADEVQTGFGRVGSPHFWAYEMSGLEPDIVVVAKGLGNGYPISAVVARASVWDKFVARGRFLFNTYGGNPMACAAAHGVLDVVEKDKIAEHAREMGVFVQEQLASKVHSSRVAAIIRECRGRGLMWGIELKRPDVAYEVYQNLMMKHHILVGLGGGEKNVLRFMPPMCVDRVNIVTFFDALVEELDATIQEKGVDLEKEACSH